MRALSRLVGSSFHRYTLVSALATATDFALASTCHALGTPASLATLLGCIAGGAVAFSLSRIYSFRARGQRVLPQIVRFLLVWASSALLNSTGVPWLLSLVPSFGLAWALTRAAVYLGWNYPLSRWFVFGGVSSTRAQRAFTHSSKWQLPLPLRTRAPATSAAMRAAYSPKPRL